jgi:hypothetical protein
VDSNRSNDFLLSDNKSRISKNENTTNESIQSRQNEYAKNQKSFDTKKQQSSVNSTKTKRYSNNHSNSHSQENDLLLFDQEPVNSHNFDISWLADFDPILNGENSKLLFFFTFIYTI